MSRVRGEDMSQMQPCHPCHCLLGECRTELLPLLSEVSQAVSLGRISPRRSTWGVVAQIRELSRSLVI